MQKILITGSFGILGSQLKKILIENNYDVITPNKKEMNINNPCSIALFMKIYNPNIIIHCAAKKEGLKKELIETNIIGTYNLIKNIPQNCKFIYISTDYVYPGIKGNYTTNDNLKPVNYYAETKLAGEIITKSINNYMIIRTSFYSDNFPYENAYIDKYTSKDYVDIIAPLIIKEIFKNKTGIVNIGTERKSEYELAIKRKKVKKINLPNDFLPKDSSMKVNINEKKIL